MRENLGELGFQVEVAENLTGLGIKQKVSSFVQRHKRAAQADGAHGAEVRSLNIFSHFFLVIVLTVSIDSVLSGDSLAAAS